MRAHTRALFLAACVALFASGAHARALLDADAVPGPAAVVCTSCKDLVAQGEAFVNDPANLEKVEVEVKLSRDSLMPSFQVLETELKSLKNSEK